MTLLKIVLLYEPFSTKSIKFPTVIGADFPKSSSFILHLLVINKTYSFDVRQGNLVEEHMFKSSFFFKFEHPDNKIKLINKKT